MSVRLLRAVEFAVRAHLGQVYRGYNGRPEEPYILHPLRVAQSVPEEFRVVAVLHDCMEDAGVLPDWLEGDERAALGLLTRDKHRVTYAEYIRRIGVDCCHGGAIARAVTLADIQDNLAHHPPPQLRARYETARDLLEFWCAAPTGAETEREP